MGQAGVDRGEGGIDHLAASERGGPAARGRDPGRTEPLGDGCPGAGQPGGLGRIDPGGG